MLFSFLPFSFSFDKNYFDQNRLYGQNNGEKYFTFIHTFNHELKMSQLDISDNTDKNGSENDDKSNYNQLEQYLSDLEKKRNDLYEKHKRLVNDFQKSAILNLENITESVQEQSDNLSKTLSSQSSSDNENVSILLKMDEETRQIDLKIMKSGIFLLECDSNIIKYRTEKLLLDKEIFKMKRMLNDKKIQFCNYKNQIQSTIMEINKIMVSLNESNSNFNYDKMKYTSMVKRIQSEINKITLYLQNCEIRKQELLSITQSSKEMLIQIKNLISAQKENYQMKQELYRQNYSKEIEKIRIKKEKIIKELLEHKNQIKLSQQDEKRLKKKMQKIKCCLTEEQNFEECLNSKLKKYNDQIEKSKQLVHTEYELLYKDLEKIKNQIALAQSKSTYSNSQINNDNTNNINYNYTDIDEYHNLNNYELQNKIQLYPFNCETKKFNKYNSKIISNYQKELGELQYDNLLLKQKILSMKKKIIESKIEFTEMEQNAAALLKASVEKQKKILLNQEQREILHDDYVTDTMIAINQAKAKIIMNKANIDSTSVQNKFASKMLRHVISCCSTKIDHNRCIFIPEKYIYLSQ